MAKSNLRNETILQFLANQEQIISLLTRIAEALEAQ